MPYNVGLTQYNGRSLITPALPQEREANRGKEALATSGGEKAHNQALANFFAGLVRKPGQSPARGSPSA